MPQRTLNTTNVYKISIPKLSDLIAQQIRLWAQHARRHSCEAQNSDAYGEYLVQMGNMQDWARERCYALVVGHREHLASAYIKLPLVLRNEYRTAHNNVLLAAYAMHKRLNDTAWEVSSEAANA